MPTEYDDEELEFTLDGDDEGASGSAETSAAVTSRQENAYEADEQENAEGKTGGEDAGAGISAGQESLTRGQTRHQRLANERNEALQRAEKAEREANELKRIAQEQQQHRQNNWQQQQAIQEQQRLAQAWEQASTEDRVAMMLQRQQQQLQAQWAQMQAQQLDAADKAAFDADASASPVLSKLAAEVETRLAKARAAGFNASRRDIAAHLIGEKVLARRGAASTAQRNASNANTRQQSVPARRSGSDQLADRTGTNSREARRKRLENMVF